MIGWRTFYWKKPIDANFLCHKTCKNSSKPMSTLENDNFLQTNLEDNVSDPWLANLDSMQQ